MSFTWWKYPTRRFAVDALSFTVSSKARGDGLHSSLAMLGVEQARDETPVFGAESVRNHHLRANLPDGRVLDVELGYMGMWTTGILARLDGVVVYESHKGRVPAYPDKYRAAATEHNSWGESVQATQGGRGMDGGVFASQNRLRLDVDIITGLLY